MENPVKVLLTGNWIMALCGCFYLAWWIVAFRPPEPRTTPAGRILLALAFLTGIAGFYLMSRTLSAPAAEIQSGLRNLWIVAGGIAVYAILLAGTALIFHRQITSELFIITAWTVLELCAVNFLYRYGVLSRITGGLLSGMILTAAVASLICYLLYYRLPYTEGYIDGCIPLILAIATIAAVNLTAAWT